MHTRDEENIVLQQLASAQTVAEINVKKRKTELEGVAEQRQEIKHVDASAEVQTTKRIKQEIDLKVKHLETQFTSAMEIENLSGDTKAFVPFIKTEKSNVTDSINNTISTVTVNTKDSRVADVTQNLSPIRKAKPRVPSPTTFLNKMLPATHKAPIVLDFIELPHGVKESDVFQGFDTTNVTSNISTSTIKPIQYNAQTTSCDFTYQSMTAAILINNIVKDGTKFTINKIFPNKIYKHKETGSLYIKEQGKDRSYKVLDGVFNFVVLKSKGLNKIDIRLRPSRTDNHYFISIDFNAAAELFKKGYSTISNLKCEKIKELYKQLTDAYMRENNLLDANDIPVAQKNTFSTQATTMTQDELGKIIASETAALIKAVRKKILDLIYIKSGILAAGEIVFMKHKSNPVYTYGKSGFLNHGKSMTLEQHSIFIDLMRSFGFLSNTPVVSYNVYLKANCILNYPDKLESFSKMIRIITASIIMANTNLNFIRSMQQLVAFALTNPPKDAIEIFFTNSRSLELHEKNINSLNKLICILTTTNLDSNANEQLTALKIAISIVVASDDVAYRIFSFEDGRNQSMAKVIHIAVDLARLNHDLNKPLLYTLLELFHRYMLEGKIAMPLQVYPENTAELSVQSYTFSSDSKTEAVNENPATKSSISRKSEDIQAADVVAALVKNGKFKMKGKPAHKVLSFDDNKIDRSSVHKKTYHIETEADASSEEKGFVRRLSADGYEKFFSASRFSLKAAKTSPLTQDEIDSILKVKPE